MDAHPARSKPGLRGLQSLRWRAVIGFCLLTAGAFVLLFLAASFFLRQTLADLQRDITLSRIDQVIRHIDQVATLQQRSVLDNAVWDEAFHFLQGKNPDFLTRNFDPKTGWTGQDATMVFNAQRMPVAKNFITRELEVVEQAPSYLDLDAVRQGGLFQTESAGSSLVATPEGLLILSAYPVMRTDGTGPSPGWLVYGQDLSAEWFDELFSLTGVVASPSYPPQPFAEMGLQQGELFKLEALGECRIFYPQGSWYDSEGITIYIEFLNTVGRGPAELKLAIPADVFLPARTLRLQLASLAIGGAIVVALLAIALVDRLFLRKISVLGREFDSLAAGGNVPCRLPVRSSDELGALAQSANSLLESLEAQGRESQVQEQLLAGILESAAEGIMAFRALKNEQGTIADFVLVMSNKAASRIVGNDSVDMAGKSLLGLFAGNLSEGVFERYVRVVESQIPQDFEVFYHQEGIRCWIHISAAPWSNGVVVTFEDVSARKRVEQELQARILDIEQFNRAMIGREERILEMKAEVNQLCSRLAIPKAYKVDSLSDEN